MLLAERLKAIQDCRGEVDRLRRMQLSGSDTHHALVQARYIESVLITASSEDSLQAATDSLTKMLERRKEEIGV